MDIICSTHVQYMYRYLHRMTMYMQCMYMVHTKSVKAHTGFNQLSRQVFVDTEHRDAEQRDIPQPSFARDDMDGSSPYPEDGDFFYARPDATETEKAIRVSKFISGLECQERSCFELESQHTLLSKLPVPVGTTGTTGSKMSHAAALEGGFLPKMDEEQQKRFTPSELLLYKHAVEYRYMSIT
jgi:hypothetical protein